MTIIQEWQLHASYSHEIEYVGEMIIEEARRKLALKGDIKALELRCKALMNDYSRTAQLIDTIPGFAVICFSELAGEIGARQGIKRSLVIPNERQITLHGFTSEITEIIH